MKKILLFLVSILFINTFIFCSSNDDNNEDEFINTIAIPSHMKGCKYNDNDYEYPSNTYLNLFCFYKEENNIIKIALYDRDDTNGNIGALIKNYNINWNTATVTGSPFNYTVVSNNIEFKFIFNNDPLDQHEAGFYQRLTVIVENHQIFFKPSSCTFVEQYLPN